MTQVTEVGPQMEGPDGWVWMQNCAAKHPRGATYVAVETIALKHVIFFHTMTPITLINFCPLV